MLIIIRTIKSSWALLCLQGTLSNCSFATSPFVITKEAFAFVGDCKSGRKYLTKIPYGDKSFMMIVLCVVYYRGLAIFQDKLIYN